MKKRDLSKIWLKLRIVINPLTPIFNDDRQREIRNCNHYISYLSFRGPLGTFCFLPDACCDFVFCNKRLGQDSPLRNCFHYCVGWCRCNFNKWKTPWRKNVNSTFTYSILVPSSKVCVS